MAQRILDVTEGEMLETLYHLRYFSAAQMRRMWYSSRTENACSLRLSRLTTAGILQRRSAGGTTIYSLAAEGFRLWRELGAQALAPTPPLSEIYLPHHIATNEVFCHLTTVGRPWQGLPFRWAGTLQAGMIYQDTRRDAFGTLQIRRAILRPDAVVTTNTRRVLIELDRSTECLREAEARRSIRRKLKAYATVLFKGPLGGGTWYSQHYPDQKPVRVLFVLAKEDMRLREPAASNRRQNAILSAARELDPRLDARCVYLSDEDAIRSLCLEEGGAPRVGLKAERPQLRAAAAPAFLPADVTTLSEFYRLAVLALQRHAVVVPIDPELRAVAVKAKEVLRRHAPGRA